jgi:DNA-binding winged helix-turn-helix (wHTH) protein
VRLRLGDFILDVDARQLLRDGEEVHLSPKAFELLKMLVEQRPRALSKQELHQQLWPATFVSESNLATLVGEIRDALGDSAQKSQLVRTAHRFGYAFCGEATEIAESMAADGGSSFCWLIKDGHRVPLAIGENVLGRDEDGIRIDSVTVSRRHARIVVSDGGAVLEDLHSKNGTYLGDEVVSHPVTLKDGDEIRTGSVVLRFRMTSPKGSTATWSQSSSSRSGSRRRSSRV